MTIEDVSQKINETHASEGKQGLSLSEEIYLDPEEYKAVWIYGRMNGHVPLKPDPPVKRRENLCGLFHSFELVEYDLNHPEYLRELEQFKKKQEEVQKTMLSLSFGEDIKYLSINGQITLKLKKTI